jgi:DNA-binding beta-propeller fold protein YncE
MIFKRRFSGVIYRFAYAVLLAALALFCASGGAERDTPTISTGSDPSPTGVPAYEIFNAPCLMAGAARQGAPPARVGSPVPGDEFNDVQPVRSIVDPYPSFNGIALDSANDLVVMSDTNKKSLLVYGLASGDNSPAEAKPLRRIIGPATNIGFIAGVAADSINHEIYAVNNDIEDRVVVFAYEDKGNVKPKRVLHVPYSSWGIAVNQRRDEIAVTVQQINAVVIYRRRAEGLEAPVRSVIGSNTGAADPHGVVWDEVNDEIFVSDHGNANKEGTTLSSTDYYNSEARLQLNSGGQFQAPAIHVYAGSGNGNVKPLRTIKGPLTGLNWPMGMAVDASRNEVAVANSADNSILFFRRTDDGNARPLRTIKGGRTGVSRPVGVAIDRKSGELWVANFGDHTAAVFNLGDGGNVAPKRIIRNAPPGAPTVGFGNPMALAYDSRREELLVAN